MARADFPANSARWRRGCGESRHSGPVFPLSRHGPAGSSTLAGNADRAVLVRLRRLPAGIQVLTIPPGGHLGVSGGDTGREDGGENAGQEAAVKLVREAGRRGRVGHRRIRSMGKSDIETSLIFGCPPRAINLAAATLVDDRRKVLQAGVAHDRHHGGAGPQPSTQFDRLHDVPAR